MWGPNDALSDLVSWSADLPLWQRDALRRLVVSGSLTDACLAELLAICCGEAGAPAALPCNSTHIGAGSSAGRTISLVAIRNPSGVNALTAGQQLTFGPSGLTVIYGENGAGKSGYARILKNACRAKDRGEVLGDVRAGSAPATTPRAEIELQVDGNAWTVDWQANVPCDPSLSLISVFDSATASVRVDQANEASYTPTPMRLLTDLASACAELEVRIKSKAAAVAARQPAWVTKPQCAEGTRAMAALRELSPKTDVDALLEQLALKPGEEVRRQQLADDLRVDPAVFATAVSRRAARFERALEVVTQAEEAASAARLNALLAAAVDARSARAAADGAAGLLFGTATIPGIGGEAWRHLWEAARRFSESTAYSSRRFPVVDDGAVCVLCVQQISASTGIRLQTFEDFVRADTQATAARAEAARDTMFAEWRELWPDVAALPKIKTVLAEDCAAPDLAAVVRRFLCSIRWSLRQFERTHLMPPLNTISPATALKHAADAARAEATKLQSSEAAAHLHALRQELLDLDGRAWLTSLKDELVAEVARLADEARLKRALYATNTRALSLKSRDISQRLVTNVLRDAFAEEVSALGIPDLRIELVDDGAKKGEQQFRLRLVAGASITLSRVLSEGEFRMVALAAFLAELRVAGDVCGIVFDDPVSSLDHRHRQAVARRIAQEALLRQVVIFTHDLFFMFLLEEAAEKEAVSSIHRQHVCRNAFGDRLPGVVDSDMPVVAQKAESAVRIINQKLVKAAAASANSPAEWEHHAKTLCNLLRLAWERALESVIGVVLRRFSPKLDFMRLRELAVLDGSDVAVARDAFDWCSRHMHTESLANPRPVPTPDEIEHRLAQLSEWVRVVRQKQDAARKA
jgi:energy-coupling factor transporter ATP-binding protein EcfA2